jgi:hypothetical protein
MFGPP